MLKKLVFLFFLFDCVCAQAQKEIYSIRSSRDLSNLPTTFRFLYSDFRSGDITFVSGKKSVPSKFNYDLLKKRLLFINAKNDTLAFGEIESVKSLQFGDDFYYYDILRGLLKVLASDSLYSLALHIELREGAKKTNAGYDGNNNGSTAVATVSKETDFTLEKSSTYYLIDKNGTAKAAVRAEFLRAFKAKEEQVRQFIRSNRIDFAKEADVLKLFQFCTK